MALLIVGIAPFLIVSIMPRTGRTAASSTPSLRASEDGAGISTPSSNSLPESGNGMVPPPPPPFFSSSSDPQFNQFDHPDTGRDSREDTPGSQHSANSIARRQGENEPDGDEEGEDEEGEDYATQASIVDKVFTDADKAAAEEEENEPDRKAGRQEGSLKWTGPELRALIISMEAHTVFEPSMSVDEKSQAWLNMVDDLNKWNKKHPRKGGRFPVRTVDACDNKWRKCLYKAIAKGESASQIASGPKEDEDTIMAACQSLKDQWEQQVCDEAVKREAKKKAKNPDQTRRRRREQAQARAGRGKRNDVYYL
ncbi:hypothetical protein CF335_g9563, partial [Tilletia laevis]